MENYEITDGDHQVIPERLRCELLENPLGIDIPNPRFSWSIPPVVASLWEQAACRVQVFSDGDKLCWDSEQIKHGQSRSVTYNGMPLDSFSRYSWRVCLMDNNNRWSPWSKSAVFETALLHPEDELAQWISAPEPKWYQAGQWESGVPQEKTDEQQGMHTHGIYLSAQASLERPGATIERARAYVTGVGTYQLLLDGKPVGDRLLGPAQSDYTKRVYYDVLAIDDWIAPLGVVRENPLDITLFLGNSRHIALYGFGKPRGFLQLLIVYDDGHKQWFCTNSSWSVTQGPILQNSLFNGEVYDSRVGIATTKEGPVEVVNPYPLRASIAPPITIASTVEAQRLWHTADGYIFDFGQNFSGIVQVKVHQRTGIRLTLRYAELVTEEGLLNPASNRRAQATDVYVCNGKPSLWSPISTYHGFRYVLLQGYEGTPSLDTLKGLFIHTATEDRGSFVCSHDGLNQVHKAILWGLRSNMMGIPTDSPQRDERHGWLGDALLAAPAALLNYETQLFYEKFLQDIVDTQREDGAITDVAPKFWMDKPADPAWGSAFISIAWYLYWYRDDRHALEHFYPAMCQYIDFLLSQTTDGIVEHLGTFGDWCAPGLVTSKKTGLPFISTWYLHHDLCLMVSISHVLDRHEDEVRFQAEANRIKTALLDRYWSGTYMESLPMTPWDFPDQSAQALALASDLLEPSASEALATYLDKLVAATSGDHVGTGIHGTRYLLEQLSRWGHQEKAFTIATQRSYPGWLYMIREGATTLWERWEHITCKGMNSHNHIMLGSIDQWFYEYVAGIMPLACGWREIGFAPARFDTLTYAGASVETPLGRAESMWERSQGHIHVSIVVPSGSIGRLFLPKEIAYIDIESLQDGGEPLFVTDVHPRRPYMHETCGHWRLPSGRYRIDWFDKRDKRDKNDNRIKAEDSLHPVSGDTSHD